jgi:hypothetical protein
MFNYQEMFQLLKTEDLYTYSFERKCPNCSTKQNICFNEAELGVHHPLRCKCGIIVFIALYKGRDDRLGYLVNGE